MKRNTAEMQAVVVPVLVAANAVIEQGHIVVVDATGYAKSGATATGLKFVGRAEQSVDNTGGANGAKAVEVKRGRAFKYANLDITQANLFDKAFIVDSQTVAKDNGANTRSEAGTIVQVDADGVWIEA